MNINSSVDAMESPSPEDVVRTVFALLEAGRFDEVAAYVDADDLKGLHRDAEAAANAPPPQPWTTEEYMAGEPGLPREIAEYYAERDRNSSRHEVSVLSTTFARVHTAADLQALDTAQLLGRWLEARNPRLMIPRVEERPGDPVPETLNALQGRRAVIGAALEDEDTAHVVYRTAFATLPPDETLHAASLRRTSEGWRMRFHPYDFLGAASWSVSFSPADADQ
ncbi:hypothetical protein [Longimicrobium terrae]|uniref:Uncharacterized protein n=1 Tax=Longimicrobium terrae TaxID=1639882 RepID=A0A841GYZ1_9BACT|nr:hypothetical protein [Longimicrobium terrae]MBB4636496.1 hypothetical protein [Longimicrobium terrae]MBB6070980.1 hypothetical protein [Longimicrobium terrae]NNC29002.1 hypothetical protein [Longimicrobium terrae]